MNPNTTQPSRDLSTLRTFWNLVAGSSVIKGNGKKITFAGPNGGHGSYVTKDPAEIELLSTMANDPNCPQVWEDAPDAPKVGVEVTLISSAQGSETAKTSFVEMPAAAAAKLVGENVPAQQNMERAAVSSNPRIAAMQEKLGDAIGATAATPAA